MIVTTLIKFIASKLSGIGGRGFDDVVEWVIEVAPQDMRGWEKAEQVIRIFNHRWAEVAGFAVRTVVQLAYAYARIKGLIPEKNNS